MAVFPVAGTVLGAVAVVCFAGVFFLLRHPRAMRAAVEARRLVGEERDPTRIVKRQSAGLLVVSLALAVLGLIVFYLLVSVLPILGLV